MPRYEHKIPEILNPQGDICVPLHIPNHPDYVKLIVRQLRQLTLDRLYERDIGKSALVVREQWNTRMFTPLIDALTVATDCFDCESGDCESYPSSSSFITYTPQNPFSEPDLVPSGYLTSPFTRFAEFPLIGWLAEWFPGFAEELTGYLVDDIIVDISSLPLFANWQDLLSGILPQITVDVSGNGIVELHLINWPLGGRAIVTVDAQPNITDIFLGILGNAESSIELNRDILSLPVESNPIIIHEVEINDETPTNHTIYITFVPVVDDSSIPVNFGGGLRKVVLCGLDSQIMPIVEDVRINPATCQLEKLVNNVWIANGDVNDCIQAVTNPMQTQINQNASNISNNQLAITANANNITENTNDISQLVIGQQAQQLTIDDHETRIAVSEANLAQNNGIVSDHENRILTLEANGGGGGDGVSFNVIKQEIETTTDASFTSSAWIYTGYQFVIERTLQNGLYILDIAGYNAHGLRWSNIGLEINGVMIATDVNIGGQEYQSVSLRHHIFNEPIGSETVRVMCRYDPASVSTTLTIRRDQLIQLTVLEYGIAGACVPSQLITFDANECYSLTSGQVGAITPNGDTGDCLSGTNVQDPDYIELEVDLGAVMTIDNVKFKYFTSAHLNTSYQIHVDDAYQGGGIAFDTSASWVAFDSMLDDVTPPSFPVSGQVVRVMLKASNGATLNDLRLDDIEVITS